MRAKPDVREKVLRNGLLFPTDKELVMLLLGSGMRGNPVDRLAGKVMDKIAAAKEQDLVRELMRIDGIGPGKAVSIGAAIEFGRRQNIHRGKVVRRPSDAVPFVQHYAMQQQEHFVCMTLTGAHEIIRIVPVSVGTVNRTMVHPREVFSGAIRDMAAAIIVCHNHPSGNSAPSGEDMSVTERLLDASECLGIRLLDHIILTQHDYFSFMENKLLFLEDRAESYQ